MKNDRSVIILGILLVLTYAISKIYFPNEAAGAESKNGIAKNMKQKTPVVINADANLMVSDTLPYKVIEAR